jgi:hypothetical protein
VDIDKSKKLDIPLWVPAISVAGPLPVPWVEQWAADRLRKDFILFHVEPSPKPGRSRLARLLAYPKHWVGETQLAQSKGCKKLHEYLGQPQLGSIITTLLSVVSGIPEQELIAAKVNESHAGRHTLAEIVARFSWDKNSRDACSLGGWAPAKQIASGSGGASSSAAPSGNSRPSSGQMAGSKRPRSKSRHYRKQFSDFEQLRFRARAMEGARVAFRSHFAPGKPVSPATKWEDIIPPYDKPPPDLTPFYGELDAPKGASLDLSEAVVPSHWSNVALRLSSLG